MSFIRSAIIFLITLIVLTYVGFGLYLYWFQKSFIYYPHFSERINFNDCTGFVGAERVNNEGTRLFYKRNGPELVVFYHGNASTACDHDFLAQFFDQLNLSYIFVEYAGYAGDYQKPNKELLFKDVENVNSFIQTKGIRNVILAGQSLGSALAAYHSNIADVNKMVFITTFTSVYDIAKQTFPVYPFDLILRENYDNVELLKNYEGELLFIHGSDDEILSLNLSRKLFDSLKLDKKSFVEIKGAKHNNLYSHEQVFSQLKDFLLISD